MYVKLGAFVSQFDNFGKQNIENDQGKKMVVTLQRKSINVCMFVAAMPKYRSDRYAFAPVSHLYILM